MKKIIKFVALACTMVFIVFFLLEAFNFVSMLHYMKKEKHFYIFDNIEECSAIENSELSGAKFEHYNSLKKDKELNNAVPLHSFCGKFSCDDFEFEIYAYEFADGEAAFNYFKNIPGDRVSYKTTDFYFQQNFDSCVLAVVNFESVYKILYDADNRDQVHEFLSEIFSIKAGTSGF